MSGRCADPERIWAAVRGEIPPAEAKSMLLHSIECPGCESAWRMAREMRAQVEQAGGIPAETPSVARMGRWRWAALAAAAAAVLAAVPLWRMIQGWGEAPPFREEAAGEIQPLVPDGAAQPRDRFLLRWSPGPPGTRYNVEVALADLRPVASARALDEAEYLVPEEALRGLPPDTRLFWKVKSLLPDGRRQTSMTYVARIE